MGSQTHGTECQAISTGAGFSSGNSLIDGSGASPAAAGLRAVATLMTGLSAGSFSSNEASAPDFDAGMSFLRAPLMAPVGAVGMVGCASLDQKTALALGLWAANMALARSDSTSAAGAVAAARSFLRTLSSRTASASDLAPFTSFLAPYASRENGERVVRRVEICDKHTRTALAPTTLRPSSAGKMPTFTVSFSDMMLIDLIRTYSQRSQLEAQHQGTPRHARLAHVVLDLRGEKRQRAHEWDERGAGS